MKKVRQSLTFNLALNKHARQCFHDIEEMNSFHIRSVLLLKIEFNLDRYLLKSVLARMILIDSQRFHFKKLSEISRVSSPGGHSRCIFKASANFSAREVPLRFIARYYISGKVVNVRFILVFRQVLLQLQPQAPLRLLLFSHPFKARILLSWFFSWLFLGCLSGPSLILLTYEVINTNILFLGRVWK